MPPESLVCFCNGAPRVLLFNTAQPHALHAVDLQEIQLF
ncbi:hypothetical protein PJE062_3039 [Pseudovibrio sp. JE062]|nr:hypothetical protein PJE062_3039 [Pseudovibrio sp. JE062]